MASESPIRPPVDLNQPVTNPGLKRALEAHGKAPTARTLASIAIEIRTANLLVAFIGDEFRATPGDQPGMAMVEEGSILKVLQTKDSQDRTLSLAFTDWEEIRRWTTEQVSTLVMPASDLFGWAFESTKAIGIVFNPAGAAVQIGTDLFRKALDGALPPGYGSTLNGRFSQLSDLQSSRFGAFPSSDVAAAQRLADLLKIPGDRREQSWSDEFFDLATTAALIAVTPRFVVGPDLFRYINARLATAGDGEADRFCLAAIASDGCESGFGLVLNGNEERADWVFSCGDMLAIKLRGSLKSADEALPASSVLQHERLAKAETVLVAAPSESYLPQSARRLLHEFMRDSLEIESPSVMLMMRPSQKSIRQLVFSLYPEDFASEHLLQSALRRMTWFVPRDYAVVAASKSSELRRNFHPLLEPLAQGNIEGAKKKPWYRPW